jgi:TatD DNase family protein
MVPITDTHVHFDPVVTGITACVQRAVAAGVTRLLAVGGSPALNASAILAARSCPAQVRLALGWDRDQTAAYEDNAAAGDTRPSPPFAIPDDLPMAAIGEVGLDYHYHPETQAAQCRLFGAMLRLAAARNLPVCIHTREADDDTCRILDEHASPDRRAAGTLGVVHCFTGGREFARALLDRGLYLGFSGIVTFRNAEALREVARFVPADRLLIETDSPFLTPVPKRGVPNEPAFVVHVADLLAKVRGLSREELAGQTSRNAAALFGPWPTA